MDNHIEQPAVQKLLQPERLTPYLATHLPTASSGEPLAAYRVRGGHSNETFILSRGDDRWVLRRPPLGPYLPTAHDVAREWRILAALQQTDVPAPQPVLFCDDTSILGEPFYLMEYLDGVVLRGRSPDWAQEPATRRAIGLTLVDTLTRLHQADWQAIGLEGFGKPEGYLERQVRRWAGQLDGARTRDIPALDQVTQWLATHIPVSPPAAIVHGDFRLDNAMYAPSLPVRIIGLLDWEMSTLGDPLADLGYLLAFWREAGDPPPALTAENAWKLTEENGYPTRAELVDRYAAQTGQTFAPGAITFYHALAIWKMAILLEGSYKRFQTGVTDDPFFEELERGVPALAEQALTLTRG